MTYAQKDITRDMIIDFIDRNVGQPHTPESYDEMLFAVKREIKNIDILIEALKTFIDNDTTPEPNCSCHICPPCSDCVEYSSQREIMEYGKNVLKKVSP